MDICSLLAATHRKLSAKITSLAKRGGRYPSSALSSRSRRPFSIASKVGSPKETNSIETFPAAGRTLLQIKGQSTWEHDRLLPPERRLFCLRVEILAAQ